MQRDPRSGSSPEARFRWRPAVIILRDLDKLDRQKASSIGRRQARSTEDKLDRRKAEADACG
jgi:hypothetical protein